MNNFVNNMVQLIYGTATVFDGFIFTLSIGDGKVLL